jgi:hypothetical protein
MDNTSTGIQLLPGRQSAEEDDLPMRDALLEASPALQATADGLNLRILEHLAEEAVIGLDALVQILPEYSWNQIFHAVDQLARLGKIVLRRHHFDYTLFSTAYPT